MSTQPDEALTELVRALACEGRASPACVSLTVERLRRLEEGRLRGGDRQTLQRLMSARRILGDWVDLASSSRPSPSPRPREPGR